MSFINRPSLPPTYSFEMFRVFVFAALLATSTQAYAPCTGGEFEMSVEGVEGIFCVNSAPICMADISDGSCPTIQEGLPYGSYCGRVASGVYGCKVLDAESIKTISPTTTPAPNSESTTSEPFMTPVSTPQPTMATLAPLATENGCAEGSSPMSVEGLEPIFCVVEPACVADNSDGNCPNPQPGLEFGSYCRQVRTNVYGCKPYNGTDIETDVSYPPVLECLGNEAGDTPVSVVGAGTFCARQPVCSGSISGACPGVQNGLEVNSICATIKPGVFGCVLPA